MTLAPPPAYTGGMTPSQWIRLFVQTYPDLVSLAQLAARTPVADQIRGLPDVAARFEADRRDVGDPLDLLEGALDGSNEAFADLVTWVQQFWGRLPDHPSIQHRRGFGVLADLCSEAPADLTDVGRGRRIAALTAGEREAVARVRALLPPGAVIAGGYVRDLLRGAEPADVDALVAGSEPRQLDDLAADLAAGRPVYGSWGRLFRVDPHNRTVAWHRDAAAVGNAIAAVPGWVRGTLVAGRARAFLPIQVVEVLDGPDAVLDVIRAFDAEVNQVWIPADADEIWALDGRAPGTTYTYNVGTAYGPIRWLARAAKFAARGFVVDPVSLRLAAWYASRKADGPLGWEIPHLGPAALESGAEDGGEGPELDDNALERIIAEAYAGSPGAGGDA